MSLRHPSGIAQALHQVFVLPSLSTPALRTISRASTCTHRLPGLNHPTHASRNLHSSSIRLSNPRAPPRKEIRTEKWDEEITSPYIYLIDPKTNGLLREIDPFSPASEETGEEALLPPEPRSSTTILKTLNRQTHRLVQFEQEHEGLPVCKIISKKAEYEREKRLKTAAKERKKTEAAAKSLKTLELNWAMDANDLGHRLDKVEEFLSEGRKVEIVLASKKRGRKASAEECVDVLRRIRARVEGVGGAREAKEMEGKVGGFVTLFFQGRVGAQEKEAET